MALKNDPKDQEARSWGERAREWFNEATTDRPKKGVKLKGSEDAVKKLKKHKRP